jgi:serine/threonine protein kinase
MNYDTKIGPRAGPRIEESDAWKQTLGIAQALMKFQGLSKGPKEPMRQPGPGLLGIHFDLKPDNILVDERGTWLITDFGQAAVIERQSGVSPRVGGHFGTDAYAPPEIDDPDTSFGRKYDVWSLGCILLEVTAFLVCGYPGLIGAEGFTGLDEARRAKPSWTRIPDERFFYQEARGGDWIVKKEILEFMDSLEPRYARALRRSDASKAFLSSILSLIKRMLQPNEKDRPDISRVIDILGSAIETSRRTTSTGNSRNNGDRKYTPSADSMKVLHWSDKHERWEDSVLTVLNRGEHIMQLRCGPVARDPIPIEFKTTGVKVLPLYAFWDPKQLAESQEWLSLAYHSKDTPLPVINSAFSFNGNAGLREVRMLQSKLMSQDIVESYDIEHVCLTKQISKRKAVGRALKMLTSKDKVKPASSGRMSFRSATLQIWKEYDECIGQDVSDNATSIYDRPPRYWDNDKLKIPTCRISIHLHQQRFICTIRIDANWVLVPDPADEHIMYFRPHPSGSKEPFHASWIRPTPEDLDNELPAGVPLSPQVLWYMEDLDTFDVSQIQLNFTRAEDRNSFKQKYSKVKEAWANAREKLESQLPVNRIPEAKPLMPPDIDVPAMPREKVELLPSPVSAVETSTSGTSIETRLSRGSTAGI